MNHHCVDGSYLLNFQSQTHPNWPACSCRDFPALCAGGSQTRPQAALSYSLGLNRMDNNVGPQDIGSHCNSLQLTSRSPIPSVQLPTAPIASCPNCLQSQLPPAPTAPIASPQLPPAPIASSPNCLQPQLPTAPIAYSPNCLLLQLQFFLIASPSKCIPFPLPQSPLPNCLQCCTNY